MSLLEKDRFHTGELLDGRYRIVKLIKSGGMGTVYKAEDICLDNRVCAIKEMLDSFSTLEERRDGLARFLSEIAVLESFRHPNIPHITDHFFLDKKTPNRYCFVMEYIDGIDLSSSLKEQESRRFDENHVVRWAIQVCEALEYLHSLDPPVAHRDIKCSNLLLRHEDQRIMLIDFGIARVSNPGEGYWIGTPGYAPPEQQMGRPMPASDFYALGATMHELLTGRRPEDFNFPSFADLGVKVSDRLAEFVGICLSLDPMDRPTNAAVMREELLDILGEDTGVAPPSDLYRFDETVQEFKRNTLDPLLMDLVKKYGNEASTRYMPKYLDYFKFTLLCPTAFNLIIKKNDTDRHVYFYEQQGILDKKEIGRINPANPSDAAQVRRIIRNFTREYEKFKSANWGGGDGFDGFIIS